MANIRTIEAGKYNSLLAEELKKIEEFNVPEWARLVKTSTHKKRPSLEDDFWYKRAASILRQIHLKGVVGIERLRTRYGGRKDRGQRPPEFRKGSGKIIRTILQQAESAGLVEKVSEGQKKGRILTSQGRELLEKTAEAK